MAIFWLVNPRNKDKLDRKFESFHKSIKYKMIRNFLSKFLQIVFLERTIVHFGEEKVLQFLVKEWIIRKYNSIQMNLFRS